MRVFKTSKQTATGRKRSAPARDTASPSRQPRTESIRSRCACGGGCPRCTGKTPASTGQPLPGGIRQGLEGRFGASLAGVRVHTGPNAARLAKAERAAAVTQGRDIYFGQGRFTPETRSGQRLLTHEVTHTLQQQPGGRPAPPAVLRRAESEAERAAVRVGAGLGSDIRLRLAPIQQRQDESGEGDDSAASTSQPTSADMDLDVLQAYMRWWLGLWLINGSAPTSQPTDISPDAALPASGGVGGIGPIMPFPIRPDFYAPLDSGGPIPDYAGILAPFSQRGLTATSGDLAMAETIFRQNSALVSVLPDLRDLAPGFIRPLIPTDWRRSIAVGLTSAAVTNGLQGDYPTPIEAADQAYFELTGIKTTYLPIPGFSF